MFLSPREQWIDTLMWRVACAAILVALLCVGVAFVLPSTPLPLATHAAVSSASPVSAPALGVRQAPTIRRARVDVELCRAKSPACGTGTRLFDLGVRAGINPAFALAIFWHESNFGLKGVAQATRSLGNIRCAGYRTCLEGYRAYPSWVAGYQDFFDLLRLEYVPRGLVTVERILPVYAPAGDRNDVQGYIADVQRLMRRWAQEG